MTKSSFTSCRGKEAAYNTPFFVRLLVQILGIYKSLYSEFLHTFEAKNMSKTNQQYLKEQITHLNSVLPTQAPLNDFVHFNPLMHYESLPFSDALREVHKKTGAYCYLPAQSYREAFHKGRITKADINTVIEQDPNINHDQVIFKANGASFTEQTLYTTALINDIKNISYRKLLWKIEEDNALKTFQADVTPTEKQIANTLNPLWQSCLTQFNLSQNPTHFSTFVDLSPVDIWKRINDELDCDTQDHVTTRKLIAERSEKQLHKTFASVGQSITMRTLLKRLTNTDILEEEQPILIRQLSAWLDLGMSTNSAEKNNEQSFYHFWKEMAEHDLNPYFNELITWRDYINSLSEDPLETIMTELMRIGIEKDHWQDYLRCLALEMPGWSGMFNWRDHNKNYAGVEKSVEMVDYLAVRLVLEHLFCRHVTRDHWQLDATLPDLRGYFKHNLNEFFVRHNTFNEELPEYIQSISDQLLSSNVGHIDKEKWREIAHLMLSWSLITEHVIDTSAYLNAWRLFHLSQHLGLDSSNVDALEQQHVSTLLSILETLDDPDTSGYLWIRAYEHNYKHDVYAGIINNHDQGRWANRDTRPDAQLIFCMDDREESVRRHLEAIAPTVETIGAAGVFGLPNNFKSLDADKTIKLAQPVVTAVHQLHEVADDSVTQTQLKKHQKRHQLFSALNTLRSHGMRQSLLKTMLTLPLLSPFGFSELLGRNFFPAKYQRIRNTIDNTLSAPVTTRIKYSAEDDQILETPSAEHNQIGLSQAEKVEKLAAYLKLTGFTSGYSRLVILMAHSSKQINNPHILAYGCGACSGRFGGPNARAFCNSVNETKTRALLCEQHNIVIPEDCWFTSAEHDTTSDLIVWADTDLIPETHYQEFTDLQTQVLQATKLSSHERCEKFASASDSLSTDQAASHVQARAASPNQPRAELGHQGCASAFIGRRSMHYGVSWDRRTFMVSYDPHNDPEGKTLEAQLLGNGVVGVGIAMDYYFSSIQNGYLGSGNKTTHNLAGNFGVMHGTSSDLQTGLARQMTELHEPMRLLVIVETYLKTVETIYARQPAIKNLVDNEWIILAVKNPDTYEMHEFKVGEGLVKLAS